MALFGTVFFYRKIAIILYIIAHSTSMLWPIMYIYVVFIFSGHWAYYGLRFNTLGSFKSKLKTTLFCGIRW